MFRHRLVLTLVSLLALGGLLASACGDGDESATTAPAAPAAEPTPAPEPAPAPPGPAPAPSEPPNDEPPDTTATEEPAPATVGDEPAEVTGTEPPAEDSATGEPEAESVEALTFPVTITSDGGTWTLEAPPQRIVSLSPAATEILFAIGAGSQVVAVDNWSTYPPEAPMTGLSGFDPNIEAITAYEPDLVVAAFDTNDLVAGLTALDIPVLVRAAPVDIEGGYETVIELGVATGRASAAEEIVGWMRAGIADALAQAPAGSIRIYHELDDTHFSVSSHSFIGAVYAALGTTNIADPADTDGYGYPQLTEEYIIEADPELIIITDLLAYTAADVAARPGWETVTAVRDGNILVVNADIASRWGPRLPQFVATVTEALAGIAAAS